MTTEPTIRRLLGVAEVASWFGVTPRTVAVWRQRGRESGRGFPAPDVEITTAVEGVFVPGWDLARKSEILYWRQRDLQLSGTVTRKLCGAAEVASWFGVHTKTIAMWRARNQDSDRPFPLPVVEIETAWPGRHIPGWDPAHETLIQSWRRDRRRVSQTVGE